MCDNPWRRQISIGQEVCGVREGLLLFLISLWWGQGWLVELLYICPELPVQSFSGNGTQMGQHLPTSGFFCWLPLLAPLILVRGVAVFVAVQGGFPPCASKHACLFLTCIFYLLLASFEDWWCRVTLGMDSHLPQNGPQGMNKILTGPEPSVCVASEPCFVVSVTVQSNSWEWMMELSSRYRVSSTPLSLKSSFLFCGPTFHKRFQIWFC